MAVLVNKSSGLAENLDDAAAKAAIANGTHTVPLYDPEGNQVNADYSEASQLIGQGYSQPRPEELSALLEHAHYNSPKNEAKAAAIGAAEGLAGPVGTLAAKAILPDEDINKIKEYNPGLHALGQMGGLGIGAFTGTGEAALLGKAGQAAEALGMGRIGTAAAKGMIENALFQAGDEFSKTLTNDPKQSAETALINVGLSGLIGAGAGAALGSVSKGWETLQGSKLGQVVEDFKGRVAQHLEHPDPVSALTTELGDLHSNVSAMNQEVYGKTGLKAQDIEKLLPQEMTPKLQEEPIKVQSMLQDTIDKMTDRPHKYGDRYPGLLNEALEDFKAATADAKKPSELFNAINELKQDINKYVPKNIAPDNPAFDSVQEFKNLRYQLRTSLEDTSVWGNAAERQAAVNGAFSEFKQPFKDFEKKFTTTVNGEQVIDPGKVNTYLNQLGKPNAEIKQDILRSFLDAAEKYKQVIQDTHANLGIENPYGPSSTSVARSTLEELTPGAKLADAMIKKGLGETLGFGIGAAAGHAIGHPFIGGLLGERLLSSSLNKVIPALIKPMLSQPADGVALKSAVQYGLAAMKGEQALNLAAKAVFGSATKEFGAINAARRDKLKERVDQIAQNQDELLNTGGKLGYYMPDHAAHAALTAVNATRYLASLRPQTSPLSPLDEERTPSKMEEAKYNRALDIAENPLTILKSVEEGSLTPQDLQSLNAMYPNLANKMRDKLMMELVDAKSKGATIPYKTKVSLSMFMGQPLESSLQPTAIMANQLVQPNAPGPMMQHSAHRTHNLTGTMKMPQSYATPMQSRQQARAMRIK